MSAAAAMLKRAIAVDDFTLPDHLNVSRETHDKLQAYYALLLKWQQTINLVSPTTLPEAWERHFVDSALLYPFIEEGKSLMDIGSGAGFPGLVLAALREGPVHLVESDKRKCAFMRQVKIDLGLKHVIIHSKRIEDITDIQPDIISARALASLDKLLELTMPFWEQNKDITLLFPKGKNAEEELRNVQDQYHFTAREERLCSNQEGLLLNITNISTRD